MEVARDQVCDILATPFHGELEPLHRVLNLLVVSPDKIVPKWPL